jgi:hypothetical protein
LLVKYDLDGDGVEDEFTATETMGDSLVIRSLITSPLMDTARYLPPFGIAAFVSKLGSVADYCASADMFYGSPGGRTDMTTNIGSYAADDIIDAGAKPIMFTLATSGTMLELGTGDTLYLCPFDTILVRINNIPRSTLDYILSAGAEVGGSNPMFGGPPANVSFNIDGENAVGCFALRNPSTWKSFILPMNLKTLEDPWVAKDGSGRKITIDENGTATLSDSVYFSNVRIDAGIRGFWVQQLGVEKPFTMKHYDEFVDSEGVHWEREHEGFF